MTAPPAGDGARVRPLRILVVNWLDRENPQAGGAEAHLHEIFGRLAGRGHGVTVLSSGWSGCAPRAALDGMDVHRAGGRYTFSLARRRAQLDSFDYVVASSFIYDRFVRFGAGDAASRAFYRRLFRRRPIAEFRSPAGSYGFHNPTLRVYRLR